MVRVIMGKKGSGKTKQMIDLINAAVGTEHGNVVCIERNRALTYNIDYNIRLVEASDYDIQSFEFLRGMISGLYAGNYDITHVFIDNFTKMLSEVSEQQIAEFLAWLNDFSEREHIQFTLSLSMDPAVTGSEITKYMI